MPTVTRSVLLSVAFGLLAGCGGSSNNSPSAAANPYTGTYSGMYYTPAAQTGQSPTSGTINLTITANGTISGSEVSTTNSSASVSGAVTSTGLATFGGSVAGTGQFSTSNATTIQIQMAATAGGNTFMILIKNPSPPSTSGSPFAGDYAGTIVNQTRSATGIIAWTIDSSGNLTGANYTDANSFSTLATEVGTVQSSGSFSETVTDGGVGTTTTGTLSLTHGATTVLQGTATNSTGDTLALALNQIQ